MDREKVIKGLEHCIINHDSRDCTSCPYYHGDCVDDLCADALALLKEQEEKIRQLRLALQIMNGNGIKVDTEGRD